LYPISHNSTDDYRGQADRAITSLRQAIAELESQEPDVVMHWHSHTWTTINPPPKNSGDVNLYYAPPQRTEPKVCCQQYDTCLEPCTPKGEHLAKRTEERNFCPRCGKRTNDIHTCTPPQRTEQDLSEQGRNRSAILGNNIEEMVNNGLPFLTALDTALKVYDHHTPRLHPSQRTEQELAADDFFRMIADSNPKPFPLPQRTWVGLTDEEIDSYFEDHGWSSSEYYYSVIKDIEKKLRELNT
jgi:hypothetical protein